MTNASLIPMKQRLLRQQASLRGVRNGAGDAVAGAEAVDALGKRDRSGKWMAIVWKVRRRLRLSPRPCFRWQ